MGDRLSGEPMRRELLGDLKSELESDLLGGIFNGAETKHAKLNYALSYYFLPAAEDPN